MRNHNYTSLPKVTNLLSNSCLYSDLQDSSNEFNGNGENMYDLNGLGEVFSDHILMSKRLQKTLYAGNFDDLEHMDNFPEHPPIELTGLTFKLFSKAVPNYGLDILDMDYVSVTSEATRISPCAMIMAMIYLERLQINNSEYLETVSPPGLFVVTMLVASKFLFEDEEDAVSNRMWAELLNFDVKELNNLEQEFLSAIDWKVFVSESEYLRYLNNLEKVIAVKQSSLRNWSSYTDIYVLMQDPGFQKFLKSFLKEIVKTTILWTLGYITAVFALYCTGIALQKFENEKLLSQDVVIKNESIQLQAAVHTSIENFYINHEYISQNNQYSSKMLVSEKDISKELFNSKMFNENVSRNFYQNRNTLSCRLIALRNKISINRLEISKAFTSHKLKINSGEFSRKTLVLNNTLVNNMAFLKIRQKRCIPVLVR
ncbi:protein CNPPD1 [Caerostris extrusa]|uniref:Protein CNPPD1 n=1 Tax=Caerostris extrusa TaxID=172846 RepID=A0AAV4XQ97_CAEEX|nr:protein CNPPD1 [Caerostris extrusa]